MKHALLRLLPGLLLLCAICLTAGAEARDRWTLAASPAPTAGPGAYAVRQLEDFSQHYLARVAGRDTNLPPDVNGHDEFAGRWTQEMLANLHDLPVGVYRQPFVTHGFRFLPARRPGRNVLVVVPGSRQPDHAILVGAHYDGEPASQGSAYDDASGCMIMLGLARALGDLWRAHGLPSSTVEFALFDAEEQGLVGSTAYTFAARHGALLPWPDLMIDEEQSGVGYPVHPFGLLAQDPAPGYAITSSALPPNLVQRFGLGRTIPIRQSSLILLLQRLRLARSTAFATLHRAYPSLPYRGGSSPAFLPADERYLRLGPMHQPGLSDNAPFDSLGVPTVTFAGDAGYYAHGPSWSFPFDQPQDTPAMLSCDTGGSPQPGAALAAALALPMTLSLQLVQAYAPPHPGSGLAVVSSIPASGSAVRFQAFGGSQLRWAFGDGMRATGSTVHHTYPHPGLYHLTVRSDLSTRSLALRVPARRSVFRSQALGSPPPIIPWHPPELQDIPGCH